MFFLRRMRHLGFIITIMRVTVGGVGAIIVIRPQPMNLEIGCGLPGCWIAATWLTITVGSWPLKLVEGESS